jgi:hypothetical protein
MIVRLRANWVLTWLARGLSLVALVAAVACEESYEFVIQPGKRASFLLTPRTIVGWLDEQGNFHWDPDRFQPDSAAAFGPRGPALMNAAYRAREPVFEYRSARLIPGIIDERCNFVPDLEGVVADFRDYRYSPDARRIYNLPGKFVKKEQSAEKKPAVADPKPGNSQKPKPHSPFLEFRPAGSSGQEEYDYRSERSKRVTLRRDRIIRGTLDDYGHFIPDADHRQLPEDAPAPMNPPPINVARREKEPVYEYRCDRLIPGILDEKDNFVPELSGKIMAMREFRYSPDGPRIYNLPGEFVKKQ